MDVNCHFERYDTVKAVLKGNGLLRSQGAFTSTTVSKSNAAERQEFVFSLLLGAAYGFSQIPFKPHQNKYFFSQQQPFHLCPLLSGSVSNKPCLCIPPFMQFAPVVSEVHLQISPAFVLYPLRCVLLLCPHGFKHISVFFPFFPLRSENNLPPVCLFCFLSSCAANHASFSPAEISGEGFGTFILFIVFFGFSFTYCVYKVFFRCLHFSYISVLYVFVVASVTRNIGINKSIYLEKGI